MYKLYCYLFIGLIFSSCTQFLDIKSDEKLLVPNSVEDAQYLLDGFDVMNAQSVPARGEDMVDDHYIPESVYSGLSEYIRAYYLWDFHDYYGTNNDWAKAYSPIYYSNMALEILERNSRTSVNSKEWDLAKGSALFYRSFYFYKLLGVFAKAYDRNTESQDLGIPLKLNTDFNQLSVRASVKECYDQIFKDLHDALPLLPNHPEHVSRPSKAAVFALLSNIHHYRREYEESLKFAEQALNIKNDLIDFNGDTDLLPFNSSNNTPHVIKFNKETIFYAEHCNSVYAFNPNNINVDSILLQSFSESDLRKQAFFRIVGNQYIFKGNLTGVYARRFGGLGTSELYLNKAESLVKLNRLVEAIDVLNIIFKHRHANGASLYNIEDFNQISLLNEIRKERRRELILRGVRFTDIKRYNMEGENIIIKRVIDGKEYLLEPNSSKYALPIPKDIIDITGMPQN